MRVVEQCNDIDLLSDVALILVALDGLKRELGGVEHALSGEVDLGHLAGFEVVVSGCWGREQGRAAWRLSAS